MPDSASRAVRKHVCIAHFLVYGVIISCLQNYVSKTAEGAVRSQELACKSIADKSLIWNAYRKAAKSESPRQERSQEKQKPKETPSTHAMAFPLN